MSATIISGFSGNYEFEPETITDNARDGITAFQFKIVGSLQSLNSAFDIDQDVFDVPDLPSGSFKVVRRNLEHIAGDPENGLYRLSVSAEGGMGKKSLYVSETSFAMQNQQFPGARNLASGLGQLAVQYNLIWLYPSATITTNSQSDDPGAAETIARQIVQNLTVSIIKDRPPSTSGPSLAGNPKLDDIYITGTSVEKAGGLFRVRATASKALFIEEQP